MRIYMVYSGLFLCLVCKAHINCHVHIHIHACPELFYSHQIGRKFCSLLSPLNNILTGSCQQFTKQVQKWMDGCL